MIDKLLWPVGPLQFDFVKDWTAELQPARLGQRPTLGQSDSETPVTSHCKG